MFGGGFFGGLVQALLPILGNVLGSAASTAINSAISGGGGGGGGGFGSIAQAQPPAPTSGTGLRPTGMASGGLSGGGGPLTPSPQETSSGVSYGFRLPRRPADRLYV